MAQQSTQPDLTIVIPAHNEEAVIAETIDNLVGAGAAVPYGFEILVVDNCSTDATASVVRECAETESHVRLVTSPEIPGYGVAVRHGLQEMSGRAVVIVMADGADDPEDVFALGSKVVVEGFDCAFGTRFVDEAEVTGYPEFKRVLNRLANSTISLLTRHEYDDFTNGFKCYSRRVIEAIEPLQGTQFELTIEMSIRAVFVGASVAVIPNNWYGREAGASKFLLFRQSLRYLSTLARILSVRPKRVLD